eukprot:245677_1
MFVNKSLFDDEEQHNEMQNDRISPQPPSYESQNHNNAVNTRQKLAERRKLISSKHKTKNTTKRKIITKTNVDNHCHSEYTTTNNYYNSVNNNNKEREIISSTKQNKNISESNHNTNMINNNNGNSPSKSRHDREDSIQNIKIIDNCTHYSSNTSYSSLSSSYANTNINTNTNTNVNTKQSNNMNEIDDVYRFLTTPVVENKVIQTYIVRNKSGISNRLYPSYCVYLKDTKNFLMFAKKKQKNTTSNYIITTDSRNCNKNAKTYLGKLRGNFVGTEFVIYDNGRSPKETGNENQNKKQLRSELGSILYETNILGTKGPRKMKVILPKLKTINTSKWQQTDTKSSSSSSMLMSTYKQNDNKLSDNLLLVLQNKSPKWNENISAYVLNFNGRVTMASVKNFQLVFANKDDVILQFGRVAKDRFTMDVRSPLTLLQAFAICLTSFDNKLACE